jgi:hypothetical protein
LDKRYVGNLVGDLVGGANNNNKHNEDK